MQLTLITIIAYLLTLLNSRRASGLNFLHRRSNSQIIKTSAVRHGSQDGTILETSAERQPRPLCKDEFRVSFPYPTGLLVSNVNDVNYCLLQHNVVRLRQSYKRVSQVEDAISEKNCAQIIHDAEVCASLNGGWTANRHSAYPTTDLPLETIFGKFSSIHGLVNGYILPEIASFFGLNEDFLSIGELFVAKYEYGVNKQAGLGSYAWSPFFFSFAWRTTSFIFLSIGLQKIFHVLVMQLKQCYTTRYIIDEKSSSVELAMTNQFSIKDNFKSINAGAHVDGTPWSFVISLNNPATDFVGGGTYWHTYRQIYPQSLLLCLSCPVESDTFFMS